MEKKLYKLYFEQSPQTGVWLVWCLDLDVLSSGESFDEALEMIKDAIQITLQHDFESGLDPKRRSSQTPPGIVEKFNESNSQGISLEIPLEDPKYCHHKTQAIVEASIALIKGWNQGRKDLASLGNIAHAVYNACNAYGYSKQDLRRHCLKLVLDELESDENDE